MKKRIHVNKHTISQNQKHGTREPPLTVKSSKYNKYGFNVKINGPSEFVYSPDKPLNCGARLWIETNAEVVLDNEIYLE